MGLMEKLTGGNAIIWMCSRTARKIQSLQRGGSAFGVKKGRDCVEEFTKGYGQVTKERWSHFTLSIGFVQLFLSHI